MTTASNACRVQLDQFLHRQLVGWTGLAEGCTEDDISQFLPWRPGEGVVCLGSDRIEYRFRLAFAAGFSEPVQLLFREGTLWLVRTGLWPLIRQECEQLLHDLGEPLERLDLVFGTGVITEGEWVYAERGLTLAVIPETGLIVRADAYRPCSVGTYRRGFHDDEPMREFPGPGR